ncbi:ras-related protein rab-13 [Anaeramoeba ignava]|uniref:Ras-related protein rab-13 n=1 Tax=Anaeramoeba ignava TaxID=1746090 RepID=A0A9Q0L5G5_ANAIG|nr:ras-related protein rab-13 [Anaeramoeba ignava]
MELILDSDNGKEEKNPSKIFICLIGSENIGKTKIFHRYFDKKYTKSYIQTIVLDLDSDLIYIKGLQIRIFVWDFSGRETYWEIAQMYLEGKHGFLLCYDITNRTSFEKIQTYYERIEKGISHTTIKYLIGTKCDLENERKVSKEEAQNLANQLGIKFYEVSAKNKININECFNDLANDILDIWDFFDFPVGFISFEKIYLVDSITEDMKKFFERKEFCDFEIECKDEKNNQITKIPIHKFFVQHRLKMDSNQFNNKFLKFVTENSKKDVEILLESIYTGKTENIPNYLIFKEFKLKFTEYLGTNYKFGRKELINDLKKLMNEETSKDFEIILGNETIKVHKLILIIRSELYRGMFLFVTEDKSNSVHDYSNKKPETIKTLINFLYTDEIPENLNKKIYQELIECVDYFQLNPKITDNLNKRIEKNKKKKKKCKIF